MGNVWVALGLTLFAGMATGVGSAIAFAAKRTDYRFLSVATGFSAGVMLYVSFVELLAEGAETLTAQFGEGWGPWINVASFFVGIALIGLIDNLIPSAENPHETHSQRETKPLHNGVDAPLSSAPSAQVEPQEYHHRRGRGYGHGHRRDDEHPRRWDHECPPYRWRGGEGEHIHERMLLRMGLLTALAIGIHNFPEGLATFLSAFQDIHLGVAIAVAIALHNIPEGISVSVPIFYATGNRRKAFIYSLLCGLAEPLGACVAYLVLRLMAGSGNGLISAPATGVLLGSVAGIMVYISLDELLPTSRAYGKGHASLFGLVGGMAVMALSLLLLR